MKHQIQINPETLTHALSKMLGANVIRAGYQTKQLQGGTLGDVKLVTGMAETAGGRKIPYKIVLKIQKKWERPGDPDSWRREHDLYMSDFSTIFSDSFRWPECYHTEMNGDEIQIWMEYIDGISGKALTIETFEYVAEELGRFQGGLYRQAEHLRNIPCLGDVGFLEREFNQWHTQTFTYDFLVSGPCRMPDFLKQMLKDGEIQIYNGKSFEYGYLRSRGCDMPEHLKQMLIDADDRREQIFLNLKSLPVVLCHRDFWIENIFLSGDKIILIDWDGAGWGFMGEDIASLIVDDMDVECLDEYYRSLIPAYYRGLSEYMDISTVENFYVREMIIIKFGYRILQEYMFSQSSDVKNQQITALQKIYDMKDEKEIQYAAGNGTIRPGYKFQKDIAES